MIKGLDGDEARVHSIYHKGREMKVIVFVPLIIMMSCPLTATAITLPDKLVDGFIVAKDISLARADVEAAGGDINHIFSDEKVLMGKVPKKFKSKFISKIYYENSKRIPRDKEMLFSVFTHNLEWKKMPIEEKMALIPEGIEPIYDDVVWEEKSLVDDLKIVPDNPLLSKII